MWTVWERTSQSGGVHSRQKVDPCAGRVTGAQLVHASSAEVTVLESDLMFRSLCWAQYGCQAKPKHSFMGILSHMIFSFLSGNLGLVQVSVSREMTSSILTSLGDSSLLWVSYTVLGLSFSLSFFPSSNLDHITAVRLFSAPKICTFSGRSSS